MRRVFISSVVLALLAGCGTSLSDSMSEGTWASYGGMLLAFHGDGTYSVGVTAPEDVSEASAEWGTWSLEGDSLTLIPDAESPFCAEVAGSYTVELIDDGTRLEAAVEDDECSARREDFVLGLTRLDSDS